MNYVSLRFLARQSTILLLFVAACSERPIGNEEHKDEDVAAPLPELMDALQPPAMPMPTVAIEDANLAQLWAMGVELLRWDSAGPPDGATADEVRLRLIEDLQIRDYWDGLGYGDNPALGRELKFDSVGDN